MAGVSGWEPKSGGTKLWSVSGHVNRPSVYELPMGYDDMENSSWNCGGMLNGSKLKAVIPAVLGFIMRADRIIGKDVRMDYEGLVTSGSSVGSGGFIVMTKRWMCSSRREPDRVYKHESCGWCTPCRRALTGWLKFSGALPAAEHDRKTYN